MVFFGWYSSSYGIVQENEIESGDVSAGVGGDGAFPITSIAQTMNDCTGQFVRSQVSQAGKCGLQMLEIDTFGRTPFVVGYEHVESDLHEPSCGHISSTLPDFKVNP
jgi:hypothetical protein